MQPVKAIHIATNGRITIRDATLDTKGGVKIEGEGAGTWVTQQSDFGTYDDRKIKWGGKTASNSVPACIIYEKDSAPVPIYPKAIRGEIPAILDDYCRGAFMRDLVAHEPGKHSETAKQLKEFLKRIPKWAWFAIFVTLSFAMMWMSGSFDDIDLNWW
jgi:hypothetical protein